MNDYKKALNFVDNLISKAEKERDTKGYRENLGYDSKNKLDKKISTLDLSYSEVCEIKDQFHSRCNSI
jgi:hypothetical protein